MIKFFPIVLMFNFDVLLLHSGFRCCIHSSKNDFTFFTILLLLEAKLTKQTKVSITALKNKQTLLNENIFRIQITYPSKIIRITFMGGGRNVEFPYYDWPFFSLHRKCLFSWSEHQKSVHHYYDKNLDFRCSDFTYGVKKDQNVENKKHQLPMAYYLWLPRPVGG
jgi:hypothetical protein